MRQDSLLNIYRRYVARSKSIEARFLARLPIDAKQLRECEPVHGDGLAYLMVRLQHLWGEYCRELVVRSAIGGCTTISGRVVSGVPQVKKVAHISSLLGMDLTDPKTKWEQPRYAKRHARKLGVANYNEIDLGLSSVSHTANRLRSVRNYLVHPNKNTAPRYLQLTRVYGLRGLPPEQLLRHILPGGATVFETWIAELVSAAKTAVR